MSKGLIIQAATLIDRWEKIASECNSAQEHENEFPPEQLAYLVGMAFGMEMARAELSTVLAQALTDATKLEPSLI